jgi:hypothetical protein
MPSATYEVFRQAILGRKLISCVYKGRKREVAPHILGFKKREEKALVFQFAGETNSALPPEGEWRCFTLGEVEEAVPYEGPWREGPSHRARQQCIDVVDVDVNIPATLK